MTRPCFESSLAEDLAAFIAFKRTLGFSYEAAESRLASFDRYVRANAPRRGALPLHDLVRGWLADNDHWKPVTLTTRLAMLRQFFLFRRRRDPAGYVPPLRWPPHRRSHFEPHVLSLVDVRAMLSAADAMRGPPPRPQTYRTLILILYCTGLRLGEAVRLHVQDVDMSARVFLVRSSKGKTRFVPFGTDLARVLREYLRVRPSPATNDDRFLLQPNGRSYRTTNVSDRLRRLFRRTGLKPPRGREGPRPTDFRHTFAVHRLTRWYRAGVDLHARLPYLSTYMGHKDLSGTQVYLKATPELFAAASRRFEDRLRRARQRA